MVGGRWNRRISESVEEAEVDKDGELMCTVHVYRWREYRLRERESKYIA